MADILEMEPVQRTQLTTQVVERIKEHIDLNDLRPGSKLPGERDLAKTLGVSRNVTREAVRALQATGILDIQPGNGIFVSHFDIGEMASTFSFAMKRQPHHLDQLVESRLVFELGVIDLVVQRITAKDIALLEDAVRRLEAARTVTEDIQAELDFHRQLVEITGNQVLVELTSFFIRFFNEAQQVKGSQFGSPTQRKIVAQEHQDIIDALKNSDAEKAKAILAAGIRRWQSA